MGITDASMNRRNMLGLAGLGVAGAAVSWQAGPANATALSGGTGPSHNRTTLTLIGTAGGPPPWNGRSGVCSAVTVDGRSYIVDLGHGAFEGIHKAGINAASIRGVFLTHLHSDHLADAYQLYWLRHGGLRSLKGHVPLYGPGPAGKLPSAYPAGREVTTISPDNPTPGTADFVRLAMSSTAYDLNLRMRDEGWPDIREVLTGHDIELPDVGASADNLSPEMEPFPVFEDAAIRVTATLVHHPPVFPAFAYRFDTEDGSIVFSGDTTKNSNLQRLARGADVLVHEAIAPDWVNRSGVPPTLAAHIVGSHTSVDELGAIAESAEVATLVISHMAPADPAEMSDGEWIRRARKGYSGKVIIGHDLDQIGVGDQRR